MLEGKVEGMIMATVHPTDDDQAALWNGPAGRAWVDAQSALDQVLKPFEHLLVEGLSADGAIPGRVLDVGCGTGSTTLAVARRIGSRGRPTGIDISAPMIAAARGRADREGIAATFIHADAQAHEFERGGFDRIISRFGVMFFEDPVHAFANLRGAARDGAELQCVAWRSPAENPFMTTAERAAAPLLPNLPARQPDAPGQFAFADRHRVGQILEESGWTDVDIRPIDVPCTLTATDLTPYLTRLGPVGRALEQLDEATRAQVIETIRTAFDPYVIGAEVRFTAACWMIGARVPAASAT